MDFDWRGSLKLGLKWFDDVYSTDVLEVLSYSDAPILAITGSDDTVMDPVNETKIVAASNHEQSKALVIDNADHTFNIFTGDMTAFEKLIAATVDWFSKTLEPVYKTEVVSIKNGDRHIPATIVIPVGEGPFPAVVINHGHGGNREENGGFAGIAEALANHEILSIRMDFPSCRESKEPFKENYLSNMISDSKASLDYIISSYNVDEANLGILGNSMGGRIALMIGGEEDNPYKAMGLLAPAADSGMATHLRIFGGQEEYDKYYEEASSDQGYANFTTIYGQEQQFSLTWFDELRESTPLKKYPTLRETFLSSTVIKMLWSPLK